MDAYERIMVALDVESLAAAEPIVKIFSGKVGYFKVGLELLHSVGTPQVLQWVRERGGRIFADVKLNDIPNTVAKASRALVRGGADFFNVHASAGLDGIKAAADVKDSSRLLVVTVLTSFSDASARSLFGKGSEEKVIEFAHLAKEAGADGIVCSPQELSALSRFSELKALLKVTPGVRPEWAAVGDQKRVLTPREALQQGSDYLVIGRPLTQPPKEVGDCGAALKKILEEIQ